MTALRFFSSPSLGARTGVLLMDSKVLGWLSNREGNEWEDKCAGRVAEHQHKSQGCIMLWDFFAQ